MSSRTCESCLGSGEKPSLGHMPPYKCTKCSGTGIIHNFNDVVGAIKDPPPTVELDTLVLTSSAVSADEPKRRGRPPKN